jgi:hypothetical protein
MPNSIIMQHEGSFEIYGQVPNNTSMVGFVTKLFGKLNFHDAKRLGMSIKDFKEKIRNDWWLFGEDAVTAGVADREVNVSCSRDLTEKRVTETFFSFFGKIEVVWSGCPLADTPLDLKITPNTRRSIAEIEQGTSDFVQKLSPRRYLMEKFNMKQN